MDILVVDDSKVMRSMVQRAIRQAGYRGLTFGEAGNGLEALAKMKEEQPRVVLSDWNMPEMTGIEFLQQVRANKNLVPFGFITSESSGAIREMAIDNGAQFILAKPFSADQVQDALSPILGESIVMAEATAFEMGKLFSELTNRQVGFSIVKTAPDTKKHVYGVYNILPENQTIVVKADLVLIGCLGGALMGLPKDVVLEGISAKPMDADMQDAMHEIMNIASTPVCIDKRAVLQEMYTDLKAVPAPAAAIVAKPKRAATFNVTISGGYLGGMFAILTAA